MAVRFRLPRCVNPYRPNQIEYENKKHEKQKQWRCHNCLRINWFRLSSPPADWIFSGRGWFTPLPGWRLDEAWDGAIGYQLISGDAGQLTSKTRADYRGDIRNRKKLVQHSVWNPPWNSKTPTIEKPNIWISSFLLAVTNSAGQDFTKDSVIMLTSWGMR